MIALLTLTLLAQSAPPPPPVTTEPVPVAGAVAPPTDEPVQVRSFADFVDHHLISLDPDTSKGAIGLKQGEKSFTIKDDDFVQAFSLVPEAQALAKKAQDDLRTSTILQIISLIAVGAGSAVLITGPLVGSAAFLPLLVAGSVLDLVGLVLLVVGLPYALSANNAFIKALSVYNHGLLQLRPAAIEPSGAGITIPLP